MLCLQQRENIRRKELLQAVLSLCRLPSVKVHASQPYIKVGRHYVLVKYTADISFDCLPRTGHKISYTHLSHQQYPYYIGLSTAHRYISLWNWVSTWSPDPAAPPFIRNMHHIQDLWRENSLEPTRSVYTLPNYSVMVSPSVAESN